MWVRVSICVPVYFNGFHTHQIQATKSYMKWRYINWNKIIIISVSWSEPVKCIYCTYCMNMNLNMIIVLNGGRWWLWYWLCEHNFIVIVAMISPVCRFDEIIHNFPIIIFGHMSSLRCTTHVSIFRSNSHSHTSWKSEPCTWVYCNGTACCQ